MGKNLHYSILEFFHKAIHKHQSVEKIEDISTSEYYIFKITRNKGMREMIVLLSDSYYHGELEYLGRPEELSNGGFILIARPEAYFSKDTQENYEEDRIIIGKIGILLGALNVNNFWQYTKFKKTKRP